MTDSSDIRQSESWGKYLNAIGWKTEVITHQKETTRIYIRHLPILGSLIKIPRTNLPLPWEKIDAIAKKHRAILVKIEPANCQLSIVNCEFFSDSWPLLPTKTIQIDLTKSEKELLANLSKDARYCLRKAEENKLRLQALGDKQSLRADALRQQDNWIELFYDLWSKNAQDKGFWVPFGKEIRSLWESFGKNSHLLFISKTHTIESSRKNKESSEQKQGSTILAGALLIKHGSVMYYMHAFSTPEGRALNASYMLVWESMLLAKKLKCRVLDLEGVWDERFPKRNKKWQGFTHFKKGFGGREIEYPGSFIKYYSPFWKLFFKLGDIF